MRDFASLYETTIYNSGRDMAYGRTGLTPNRVLQIGLIRDPVSRYQTFQAESILDGIYNPNLISDILRPRRPF